MLNHYLANVRFMDKCVESSLRLQCLDENSSSYGTFWDVARGYNEPCTGISLPFFSYGGTALLIQLGEMGIILSASRNILIEK